MAPYCDAAVGIVVAERLCMCVLGHDSLSKMLVERINGIVVCMIELLREFTRLSVGRAGEKRGDVARFVATSLPSNDLHQRNTNPMEDLRKPWITDSCKTRYYSMMCSGIAE